MCNVNIIYISSVRLYFRKDYVCHHSSFKKVDKDKNLKKSKNMSCPAKVSIKVKKTTTDTVKKDKYVKVRIIIHIDYNIIAQYNICTNVQ